MKNLTVLLLLIPSFIFANPMDSIGTKTEDGVVYVMHKVERGETLFGIARKYSVNANEITKANPGTDKGIRADAILLIPRARKTETTTTTKPSNTNTKVPTGIPVDETNYHTVVPGDGLYKIASKYGVTVSDIKMWNGLESDVINVGQQLAVSEPRASLAIEEKVEKKVEKTEEPVRPSPTTVRKTEVVIVDGDMNNHTTTINETKTNVTVVTETVEGNPANEETVTLPSRKVRTLGDEIIETGTVSISNDGELNQERNFILHPTAKIGTIVMITNPENGKSAFARVVGNYRATAEEVAKINPTLSKKLSISESTKSVKINYAK